MVIFDKTLLISPEILQKLLLKCELKTSTVHSCEEGMDFGFLHHMALPVRNAQNWAPI